MLYQHWLKTSGMGAYLEDLGKSTGSREKGSFMANRCCDLVRCLLCLKPPEDAEDDDHTSEGRARRQRRKDAAAAGGLPDTFFSPSGAADGSGSRGSEASGTGEQASLLGSA